MSQYRSTLVNSASVTTTANSNVVIGENTEFTTYLSQGSMISIGDSTVYYTISSVVSDTELRLTANFPTALVDAEFVAVSDFTPNKNIPLLNSGDLDTADILSEAFRRIDTAVASMDADLFSVGTMDGLTFGYNAGRIRYGATIVPVAAGSVILTDNATNYVEVGLDGTVHVNVAALTPDHVPLFTVVTSNGAVSTVTDLRTGLQGQTASSIVPSTANFNHALTSADNTVQKALDTLSKLTIQRLSVADIANPIELQGVPGGERGRIIMCYHANTGSTYDAINFYAFDPEGWTTSATAFWQQASGGGLWVTIGPMYTVNGVIASNTFYCLASVTGSPVRSMGNYQMMGKVSGYLDIIARDITNNETQAVLQFIKSLSFQSPDLSKTHVMTLDNAGVLQHPGNVNFAKEVTGDRLTYSFDLSGNWVLNNVSQVDVFTQPMINAGSFSDLGVTATFTYTGTPSITFSVLVNGASPWEASPNAQGVVLAHVPRDSKAFSAGSAISFRIANASDSSTVTITRLAGHYVFY